MTMGQEYPSAKFFRGTMTRYFDYTFLLIEIMEMQLHSFSSSLFSFHGVLYGNKRAKRVATSPIRKKFNITISINSKIGKEDSF